MRAVVLVVCLLVLVSVATPAAGLSPEELLELENILEDYETVEELLSAGLGKLNEGQIALLQGTGMLIQGINYLSTLMIDLETSLDDIEAAAKADRQRQRKLILILVGVVAAETAAVIIWR